MAEPRSDETEFLASYDPTAYPPVAVAVDVAALTIRDGALCILAIQRSEPPFRDHWALPGRFAQPDATLEFTAIEAASVRANVPLSWLEQLGTYSEPNRDPRMRVISVGYLAFGVIDFEPTPGYHANGAEWLPVFGGSIGWAFDHGQIAHDALTRAQSKLEYTSLATKFLPEMFTVADLRKVYETIWNRPVDPGNFQRKVTTAKGFLEPVSAKRGAARLFRAGGTKLLYPPIKREMGDWT